MRTITIELPDWTDERHIFIMAGIEMAAYALYGEEVIHIKEDRCNFCGECCRNLKINIEPIGPDKSCIHLETPIQGMSECGLGRKRPFDCSTGMHRKGRTPGCCITYRAEKI